MRINLSTVAIGTFALLFVALVALLITAGPIELPWQQPATGTPVAYDVPGGSCLSCA